MSAEIIEATRPEHALIARIASRNAVISGSFTLLGLLLFFTYMLLHVLTPSLLAARIGGGSNVTIAIALGYAMILANVILMGAYIVTRRRTLEPMLQQLHRKSNV